MKRDYRLLKLSVLITVFLTLAAHAQAGFDFNDNCTLAYSKMMALDLNGASVILEKEKEKNPSNIVPQCITHYSWFIRIALNESKNEFDSFIKASENLIRKVEQDPETSPYKKYFVADLRMQMAMIEGIQKAYFSAMLDIRSAYQLIEENQLRFPDFIPNLKIAGMLNVALGSVPSNYGWLLGIAGLEGDIDKGLLQLKTLKNKSKSESKWNWVFTESLLLYNFLTLNFGSDTHFEQLKSENVPVFDSLASKNPFICYAATSYYRKSGRNEKVIKVILSYKKPVGFLRMNFLDFLLGEAYLYKLDAQAVTYFNKFLSEFQGSYFRKTALQYLAWYSLINHQDKEYKILINRIITEGSDFSDSDKNAMKAAQKNEILNPYLLRCRLLFDGGYYREAVEIFQKHKPSDVLKTPKEVLEYYYRLGRIYDEWGKEELAEKYYLLTIKTGRDKPYYFAANSALHLGMMYERQGKKAAAKQQYDDCLKMDFDEYHNSITQKAKAGLNRLKKK